MRGNRLFLWVRRAAVAILLGSRLGADVALGPLFTDGAVLQCDKPVSVWGSAAPGELVQVSFAGQERFATADREGRWIAILDPLAVNATGTELTVKGKANTVVVRDVLVGEVWLCSGQSNMEWKVRDVMNAEREIAGAQFPLIRHIAIERKTSTTPAHEANTSGWKEASPVNVGDFTAVGYFFARDLHLRLNVPIGLVHSSWGGTPVEAWMSPMALQSDPGFQIVAERWTQAVATFPTARAEYLEKTAAWTAAEAAQRPKGEKAYVAWLRQNPRPRAPLGGPDDPWAPSGLFNGMINPLVPYALRGVLWYQGESNTGRPNEYQALFSAMITAWRAHFAQGDVPFYWVNLANFRPIDSTEMSWAHLREAQTKTLALPNTGQVLAIDIGDPNDIHPRNKQEVGRRLALLAKNRLYGVTADDTGPTFASATREGPAVRVRFTHVSGALVAYQKPPQGLELAGPDGVFRPAQGRIDRDTLLVSSRDVKEPTAVRYAWRNAPEANLKGGSGLPVVPFQATVDAGN